MDLPPPPDRDDEGATDEEDELASRPVHAVVNCRPLDDGGVAVSIDFDRLPVHGMADHSYLVHTAVATPTGTRSWWYGGGSALTEEPIGDDPPCSGEDRVPAWIGLAEVTTVLRLRVRTGATTLWFRGAAQVTAGGGRQPVPIVRVAPQPGPHFDLTLVPHATPRQGPALLARAEGSDRSPWSCTYSAVMPGVGVYDPLSHRLLTEAGATALPRLLPSTDLFPVASYSGPGGALCVVGVGRGMSAGACLSFLRLPGGSPTHLPTPHQIPCGAFDETGERFATVLTLDGPKLVVLDVASLSLLTAAPLVARSSDDDRDGEPFLEWRGDAVLFHHGFAVDVLDVPPGAPRSTGLPPQAAGAYRSASVPAPALRTLRPPRALRIGWRQYGAGAPYYHPGVDRVAWMLCAEFPDDGNEAGTSLIGWADGDGSHGTVAVPDHGWSQGTSFASVRVLDDGRIVAVGSRIWLVEPATARVRDLGPAGDYPRPLPVSRVDGRLRLWSCGPGPWWTELDPA